MSDGGRGRFAGRGLVAAAVTAGILVVGGGAAAIAAGGDDDRSAARSAAPAARQSTPPSGRGTPADAGPAGPRDDGPVTAAEAAAAALKAVPGKVEEIDLEDSVWEIDLLADRGGWRDVTVDARSGKVLSDRADDDDDDDDRSERAALRKAKVTAIEAAGAALKRAPGTVTSVEFDDDDGKAVWEVEITGQEGNERELIVNAKTAKVSFDDDDDGDDDGDDN